MMDGPEYAALQSCGLMVRSIINTLDEKDSINN